MAKYGFQASYGDAENGMIESDMRASLSVANSLDEVIIFRSTGPWSQRWIKQSYPTKNFHVKGKSSDWGPQAGFVPYLGKYSKVGHDQGKANDGTAANDDGLKHRFAGKVVLKLSMDELKIQNTLPCEVPPRLAVHTMEPVPDSKDYFLFARRSGDQKDFAFRAVANGPLYYIHVYDETLGTRKARLMFEKPVPLASLLRVAGITSTAARRFDCSDVDLRHLHHRVERALRGSGIGIGDRFRQDDRCDLPGHSPFVLAPAARALLATVADDRVPITIRFRLVGGCDLKRERFVVLERRSPVEAEARNAHHRKLDGQHVAFLPRRKVSRCAVHCGDGRIGKGLSVEPRRVLGVAIIPKTNRVLWRIVHVVL